VAEKVCFTEKSKEATREDTKLAILKRGFVKSKTKI